jgi:soluble lytic murein transglycosylase
MTKNNFIVLILLLLIVTACDNQGGSQNDNSLAGATVQPGETTLPTPTLAPGLPTPTSQPILPANDNGEVQTNGDAQAAVPTATLPPTITPTSTPEPVERFPLGQEYFYYENYQAAAQEFQIALTSGVLDGLQTQEALLKMGQSYHYIGQYQAAADAFNELLAQFSLDLPPTAEPGSDTITETTTLTFTAGSPGQTQPADAYFWLGESYRNLGDCPAAIGAYETYLSLNSDLAAYVQPLIAACHLASGDKTAAYTAYHAAAAGQAPNTTRLNIHHRLAEMYLEDGDYEAAIAEYEAVLSFAITENTRGQTHYLIGAAAQAAGNDEVANENFLIAMTEYPRAHESYLSLVQLVEAGFSVDQFQRGLVDYYADVFDPAIAAFLAYVEANPSHREDVHFYLAWSYEALGNIPSAVSELDAYIEANEPPSNSGEDEPAGGDLSAVATGILEKGKLQARAGRVDDAIASYQTYLERFPDGEDAPFAAWWSAALTELQEDIPTAITLYQEMAANYPDHQDADEALFQAGYLYRQQGSQEEALAMWQQTAETYPDQRYGAASLLWLLKFLPADEAEPFHEMAASLTGDSYFSLRAVNEAQGTVPFLPIAGIDLDINRTAEQSAAEEWLRTWLQLEPGTNVSDLSAELASDSRLVRGEKLWRLGMREQAKIELEIVRQGNTEDVLASYQLALFFRDMGLYRSSILAAERVMLQAGVNGLTAPAFLAHLAYPIYYADLITAEAQKYGYDPLLQFSLVRQESLYESFATSSAVAQGLSQVIPDTGAYIATRLEWPDYENEDLYRPYVGIAFGGYYLDQQLENFDGFVPAALSAYNAGPGNAARWYGLESDDIDLYHEIVNFAETRLYIERIYIGHVIYMHLYGE